MAMFETNTMKKLTLLVVTIMFLSSCDGSFLDLTSKEATDGENAIVDIKSMEYATYGVYALAQNQHYYNRTFYFLPDLISDNVYLSTRTRTYYTELGKFRASANHSRSGSQWEQIYRVVVNSNFIIQKGSELEVPEGEMEEKEAMEEKPTRCGHLHILTCAECMHSPITIPKMQAIWAFHLF